MSEMTPDGDWIECWQCFGWGATEDCFEDTCVCLNPPCYWNPCDICHGNGGWFEDIYEGETAEASTAL